MSLPPILTNLPFLKVFKDNRAAAPAVNAPAPQSAPIKDVVEISSAAVQKLQGVADSDAAKVQTVATQTRALLAESTLPLGLDPNFS